MGPSHKVSLDFVAQTLCSEWATPLGSLKVDVETVQRLSEVKEAQFDIIATKYEENEHSLEMHLPFIKKMFYDANKEVLLVPLMVGQVPMDRLQAYAKALLPLFLDQRTLFVVSSDFCHWGERFDYQYLNPEEKVIFKSIEMLDRAGMQTIESQSVQMFH